MTATTTENYAAVDLGSNSFHMIVASYQNGHLQIIDRIKDMVSLATGLDDKQNLSEDSMQRALECLQRFGQRTREIPGENIRVVGTNTLRQARNGKAFLARAREALGHHIEIIAGREEARLIFLGVAHTVYSESDRRLVVDIGGGSTELIIGRGLTPALTESLYMGCVNMARRFFETGEITQKRIKKAVLFAMQELEVIQLAYRKVGWDSALGSSGTILAIDKIMRSQGWGDKHITLPILDQLLDYLAATAHVNNITLPELSERRRPNFVGGVVILRAIFEALDIKAMDVSEGALREGLLYDLISRVHDQDIRDKTITDMAQRYNIDQDQAERVRATTEMLFKQAKKNWGLDKQTDMKLLQWAAWLHEIGLFIAHAQQHRHGSYLLAHSDMPGFSRQDQLKLAVLVRLHRRKFTVSELDSINQEDREKLKYLCILLRLAIVLNRSRSSVPLPEISIKINDSIISLTFPEGWLDEHRLTQTDLEMEKEFLKTTGLNLEFS